MKLRTMLVDDEYKAIEVLKYFVETYTNSDVEVIGFTSTSTEAVGLIQKCNPQLVILDIDMPDLNGIELLNLFPDRKFACIYTTAHKEFALPALKLGALDYLLKPIDPVDFYTAIQKAKRFFHHGSVRDFQLAVHSHRNIEIINIQEIVYLKADGIYTELNIKSGKIIVASKNLKYFEDQLIDSNVFFRAHNSYLVNINYISALVHDEGYFIRLHDKNQLPVATRKWESLKEFMNLL